MLSYIAVLLLGPLLPIWVLLKLRLLPDKLMVIWFGLCLALGFIWLWAVCLPVYGLSVVAVISKRALETLAIQAAGVMLRVVRFLNPQLRAHREYSRCKWSQVPDAAHILHNHTSFWDSLFWTSEMPLGQIASKKTLMKASLSKMPIAGFIMFVCIRVFPVYFNSDKAGSYGVDKEKQAAVQKDVDDWFKMGNGISFCPEGAVSPDPNVVQPMRFGSMKMLAESGKPIYVCTHWNNTAFWGAKESIGGHAADISMSVAEFKYTVPRDANGELDVAKFAEQCRSFMQQEVDRLKAIHEKLPKS